MDSGARVFPLENGLYTTFLDWLYRWSRAENALTSNWHKLITMLRLVWGVLGHDGVPGWKITLQRTFLRLGPSLGGAPAIHEV